MPIKALSLAWSILAGQPELFGTSVAVLEGWVQEEVFLTRRKSQGGQTIILLAVALPLIFGMVGLAFDIGYFEYKQRLLQTAADAGAIAGAINLSYGTATAG